jgi:mono/diheme cytochrome c family protein
MASGDAIRRRGLTDFRIPVAWVLPTSRMVVALSLLVAAAAQAAEPASSRKIDFNYQIRPILSDKCFNCHGPDPRHRKAGLRLDTKDGAFARLKSDGHAIVPGNLDESEIVARTTAEDETDRMPPKSLGRTLTPQEINLLKQWVEQGAEWKNHWAFIPPGDPPLPDVKHSGWLRNAIDRFVLARLEAEGLTPSPEAKKAMRKVPSTTLSER